MPPAANVVKGKSVSTAVLSFIQQPGLSVLELRRFIALREERAAFRLQGFTLLEKMLRLTSSTSMKYDLLRGLLVVLGKIPSPLVKRAAKQAAPETAVGALNHFSDMLEVRCSGSLSLAGPCLGSALL